MIDLADIITRVTTQTGFITDWCPLNVPTLEYNGVPLVYVGYGNIRSSLADRLMDANEYNVNGEGMVQVFETHLICPPIDFYINYKLLYKALNQFNPITLESSRTAISYLEGGVVGLDNGVQRHLDRWRVGFSTVSNDF
jgi:hypothetical protein